MVLQRLDRVAEDERSNRRTTDASRNDVIANTVGVEEARPAGSLDVMEAESEGDASNSVPDDGATVGMNAQEEGCLVNTRRNASSSDERGGGSNAPKENDTDDEGDADGCSSQDDIAELPPKATRGKKKNKKTDVEILAELLGMLRIELSKQEARKRSLTL